jgi:hypothetical protein
MAPKKDTKEASASTKKKDTPAAAATTTATATASAKKPTKPASGTSAAGKDATKVVTKDRKEKVQSKALKAKQRVVR